ncbi:MAG TPA: hypothetical protein VFP34_01825 [Microlunatus sp.]|nr:hypothetical protein [Microlunatus sp.]
MRARRGFVAFNARWQVPLIDHNLCDYPTIALVQDHQDDYLSLTWHQANPLGAGSSTPTVALRAPGHTGDRNGRTLVTNMWSTAD